MKLSGLKHVGEKKVNANFAAQALIGKSVGIVEEKDIVITNVERIVAVV